MADREIHKHRWPQPLQKLTEQGQGLPVSHFQVSPRSQSVTDLSASKGIILSFNCRFFIFHVHVSIKDRLSTVQYYWVENKLHEQVYFMPSLWLSDSSPRNQCNGKVFELEMMQPSERDA